MWHDRRRATGRGPAGDAQAHPGRAATVPGRLLSAAAVGRAVGILTRGPGGRAPWPGPSGTLPPGGASAAVSEIPDRDLVPGGRPADVAWRPGGGGGAS